MSDVVKGRDLTWVESQPKRTSAHCYWPNPVECPACLGRGKLTPTLHCANCNGWGYLEGAACLHEWRAMTVEELKAARYYPLGRCESARICAKCGESRVIDSSD